MSTTLQNKKTTAATANFETDASKIVHRHLENKDDVITEEDIRGLRVGVVTQPASATVTTEETSGGNPVTPWDVVDGKE